MKFSVILVLVVSASVAFGQNCCGGKDAKAEKAGYAKQGACGGHRMSAEEEFMMEARRMAMQADANGMHGFDASVQSEGHACGGACCAKGAPAKFKVFVSGAGYQYFGCEGSAKQGRQMWASKGKKVGAIQKVALRK